STSVSYLCLSLVHRQPSSPLFPYTTLFRSVRGPAHDEPDLAFAHDRDRPAGAGGGEGCRRERADDPRVRHRMGPAQGDALLGLRSEEHTSELQSRSDLVCRLLLEKKKTKKL